MPGLQSPAVPIRPAQTLVLTASMSLLGDGARCWRDPGVSETYGADVAAEITA